MFVMHVRWRVYGTYLHAGGGGSYGVLAGRTFRDAATAQLLMASAAVAGRRPPSQLAMLPRSTFSRASFRACFTVLLACLCFALPSRAVDVEQRLLLTDQEPTVTTINLLDVCQLGASVDQFLRNKTGEVCQLKDTVIGSEQVRRYSFQVEGAGNKVNIQTVMEIFKGNAIVSYEHESGPGEAEEPKEIWSAGSHTKIYEQDQVLEQGTHYIVVKSLDIVSLYNMRVEIFRSDLNVNVVEAAMLKSVELACCKDGCEGILGALDTLPPNRICNEAGVHCDTTGHISHLDLAFSNMTCDLKTGLQAVKQLPNLQSLEIGNNDLTGKLEDTVDLFSRNPDLRFLGMKNLPGVTGSLPADCKPPFNRLIHLGLSFSGVTGSLPACILNSVHQLEIAGTNLTGEFPALTNSNNLRFLHAAQGPNSKSGGFTGKVPNLNLAAHLHYLNLNGHKLGGVLTLAHNVEAVSLTHNSVVNLRFTVGPQSPKRLQYLDLEHNQIAGALSPFVPQLKDLVGINLANNQLESIPPNWTNGNLHSIRLNNNAIKAELPAEWATFRYLRELILHDNQFTGTLDLFVSKLEPTSVLQYMDLGHNVLEGELFGPDLIQVAALSSGGRDGYEQAPGEVFLVDLSSNKFSGLISTELLKAFTDQVMGETNVRLVLEGNSLQCPAKTELNGMGLTDEQLVDLGCIKHSSGGPPLAAIVGGAAGLLALIAVIVMGVCLYKRRTKLMPRRNGIGRLPATTNEGWLTGTPNPGAEYHANLSQNKGWGLGKGRGGKHGSNQSGSPQENDGGKLGVFVAPTNGNVMSVEMATPEMTPKGDGETPARQVGAKELDEVSDEDERERTMRVTFNAAFTDSVDIGG